MLSKSFKLLNQRIFVGPSVGAKYSEALQKLNAGLVGHTVGGTLILLSATAFGASPLTSALFASVLWMQIMSSAKVTEIGSWVNLCKNVVAIEPIDGKWVFTTDASELILETAPKTDTDLPTLKELRELGILYLDQSALEAYPEARELFERDDLVVTMNESMKNTLTPPPGAAKTAIPKLAEIYQRRLKAIESGNKRMASLIANAKPMDPEKMLDRLGTASVAMGGAMLLLGTSMYIASKNTPSKRNTEASSSS